MRTLVAVRRCLVLASRQARVALRAARREEVVRSCSPVLQRRLRTWLLAIRHTREKIPQAAVSTDPIVRRRDEAAGAAGCQQVVVAGDSLGAEFGDLVAGLELVGWADRLALALRSHHVGVCLTDLAQSGLTTTQIIRTQLDHTIALRPQRALSRSWRPSGRGVPYYTRS